MSDPLADAVAELRRTVVQAARPHPAKAAITEAVAKLVGFVPASVVGEPDLSDARALADDLMAVAAIVDPVIRAYGDYAQSTLGVSAKDVDELFTDQLRGALEGNATFVLEQTVRTRSRVVR